MAVPYAHSGQYAGQLPEWQRQGYQPPTFGKSAGIRPGEFTGQGFAFHGGSKVAGVTQAVTELGKEVGKVRQTLDLASTRLIEGVRGIRDGALSTRNEALKGISGKLMRALNTLQAKTTHQNLMVVPEEELNVLLDMPGALHAVATELANLEGMQRVAVQAQADLAQHFTEMEAYYQGELNRAAIQERAVHKNLIKAKDSEALLKVSLREKSKEARSLAYELKIAKGQVKSLQKQGTEEVDTGSLDSSLKEAIEKLQTEKDKESEEFKKQIQIIEDELAAYKLQLQETEGVTKSQVALRNLKALQARYENVNRKYEEVCRQKQISEEELSIKLGRESAELRKARKELGTAEKELEAFQKRAIQANEVITKMQRDLEQQVHFVKNECQYIVTSLQSKVDILEEELAKLTLKNNQYAVAAQGAIFHVNWQGAAPGFDDSDNEDETPFVETQTKPALQPASVPMLHKGTPLVTGIRNHSQQHTHTHLRTQNRGFEGGEWDMPSTPPKLISKADSSEDILSITTKNSWEGVSMSKALHIDGVTYEAGLDVVVEFGQLNPQIQGRVLSLLENSYSPDLQKSQTASSQQWGRILQSQPICVGVKMVAYDDTRLCGDDFVMHTNLTLPKSGDYRFTQGTISQNQTSEGKDMVVGDLLNMKRGGELEEDKTTSFRHFDQSRKQVTDYALTPLYKNEMVEMLGVEPAKKLWGVMKERGDAVYVVGDLGGEFKPSLDTLGILSGGRVECDGAGGVGVGYTKLAENWSDVKISTVTKPLEFKSLGVLMVYGVPHRGESGKAKAVKNIHEMLPNAEKFIRAQVSR